jgi:membrane protein DedA with SNARE-associated domain
MGDWIVEVVGKLGYAGIFLLTLLENVFPPIPSELIMPLAGYHAAQGRFGLWGAIAAGSVGSALGTVLWYWIGHRIGERRLRDWADRHGRWLTLDGEDIDKSAEWFHRRGVWAVFICRMIPGLRTWISLPAGFSGMSMGKFLLPTVIGTVLWTTALTAAGYWLGAKYSNIDGVLGTVSWVVIGLIAVLYVYRLMTRTYPGTRSNRSKALPR